MFEFFTHSEGDAVSILKDDHKNVEDLFDRFENAEMRKEKIKIAVEAIKELKIHAAIEEEIFYPAVRGTVGKKIMNEADEEHHVAKILIAELEKMDGTEDNYDAKFIVLAENVRHHIREEEGDMLPIAEDSGIDMDVLGKELLMRKQQLARTGVPASVEEKMAGSRKRRGTSLVRAAKPRKSMANGKSVKHLNSSGRRKTAKTSRSSRSGAYMQPSYKNAHAN